MTNNHFQHWEKENSRSAAGQALVEFALIISFVLVFAFIIIESGRLFQAWQTVQNAAREAGRYALTGQYDPSCLSASPACNDPRVHSIRQASLAAATGLVIDPSAGYNDPYYFFTEVMARDQNGQLQQNYAGVAGQPVYVRVTYRMALITPVLSSLFPSVRLLGSVTVNNEDFDQYGLSPGGTGAPIGINPPPPQELFPDLWVIGDSLPSEVLLGQEYDYRLTVLNIGAVMAADVQLVNQLPAGTAFVSATAGCTHAGGLVSCSGLGDMEANDTLQVMIRARAPITITTSPTVITNTVTVSTSTPEVATGNNQDEIGTIVRSIGSDLAITSLTNLPEPVLANQQYELKATIINQGPDLITTTNTVLSITFKTDLDFSFISSSGALDCARDGNDISCDLVPLDNGDSVVVSLIIEPKQQGGIQHVARVSADQFDNVPGNNRRTSTINVVVAEADLRVTAASQPAKVMLNETVLYRLQVVNLGPAIANDIVVTNTLPATGEFVSVSGPACGQPDNDGVFTCTIGKLSPLFGQNVVDIVVEMTADTESIAPMVNTVVVEAEEDDPNPSNNIAQAVTLIEEIDLVITKGPNVSKENRVIAGDVFEFTMAVTNRGPSLATGVWVTDELDETFQFVSATTTQGACYHTGNSPGGTVFCSIGSLAVGASATITLRIVPTVGGDKQGNNEYPIEYFNTATVTGNENERPENLDNNSSIASIWVLQGDQFITLSPSCGDPGQTITVAGYNWQTGGNWQGIEIRWEGITLRTVPPATSWTDTITVPTEIAAGNYEIWGYQRQASQGQGQGSYRESSPKIFTVPCPKPDLRIANLQLGSQEPIYSHTPITFTATISNSGDKAIVDQFYLSLYLNPPTPTNTTTHIPAGYRMLGTLVGINRLEIGESKTIVFTAVAGLPNLDSHMIYAVVDSDPGPYGNIIEHNERNNLAGPLSVQATQPGDPPPSPPQPGAATGNLAGQVLMPTPGAPEQPYAAVYIYSQSTLVSMTYSDFEGTYSFAGLPANTDPDVGTPYSVAACFTLDGVEYFELVQVDIFKDRTTLREITLRRTACWFP